MLTVHVIGMGPGNPELLTEKARRALAEATILVGDVRLLDEALCRGKRLVSTFKAAEIRDIAAAADGEKDCLAVLVSGDVGFFSLAKGIADFPDCRIIRHPGISSLVYFAALIGTAWEDAFVVSRHGRQTPLTAAVMTHEKVFCLTGGDNSVRALCAELCAAGLENVQVAVGENLSYDNEKITRTAAADIREKDFSSLAVMMIFNDNASLPVRPVHGWEDELFHRGRVPMTKQEVRALAISKLQPQVADIIYDIGAGTGACSVELAFQAPLGRVYAFELKAEALSSVQQNKERFGAENLHLIAGNATETMDGIERPDCAFIGGTKGEIALILDKLYGKNPSCRIVITAITLETVAAVTEYYKDKPSCVLNTVQLFAARDRKVGAYTLMEGQNPVYVMSAAVREADYGA